MESVTAIERAAEKVVEIQIERDCTITFEGNTFESGGAMVTPNYAIGYMSSDMRAITTWEGQVIGNQVRVVSSWPMPGSYLSDRQYHVEATIAGRRYTGRTLGAGMLWRGKAKKES